MNTLKNDVRVSELMQKEVVTIPDYATVRDAAIKMRDKGIGSVVIVKDNQGIGILTDRDIVVRVVSSMKDPEMVLVREIMSTNIIFVHTDTPINDAASLMVRHSIKKLPVTDKKGNLVGILTYTDLLRAYPGYVEVLKEIVRAGTCGETHI
ncbi:MAG: CBS domain-containing protein [Candidatus Micrarchaeota archaeon]|nr:CBS domain-containing protein [Candidatus Micrarchaeota archaeon]